MGRRTGPLNFALAVTVVMWTSAARQARADGMITIASFNGANGAVPIAGVTIDPAGNIFGTANSGGTSNRGTVWEIPFGSSTITALGSLSQATGYLPYSGVTIDSAGNLYGTGYSGGVTPNGTVWEIAAGSGTITALANFSGSSAGGWTPIGGVAVDASGNLYGTTQYGGQPYGYGTVWEIAKGSGTITTLASLGLSNGGNPEAGLTFDRYGNLYGTSYNGGANNAGTVWELAKGSSTITTLASFGGSNGAHPASGVTIDAGGNLYGTTVSGGASGVGTVWEIAKGSGTITTLASFNGTNGASPFNYGSLALSAGNIYGTTSSGGAFGNGTLWEIANGSNTIRTLLSFNGSNGAYPFGAVTVGLGGTLYGTTDGGGAYNDGTVWSYNVSNVPEPSTLAFYLATLGVVAAKLARRRRST
jgi:uncharacterized repeat protein (TIGR03803 family)